jgi:glycosyltransferase involved in cell wall biosynthesis
LNILLIEPFYSGSHKQWADGWKKHSQHNIEIWSLPGRHWKWRMHGAAISFAKKINKKQPEIDLIVVSDFLDLATFKGLTDIKAPTILYFHENQFAYPWSASDPDIKDKRDRRYMWINYTSALAAEAIWFNSEYNKHSLMDALPAFMNAFPDDNAIDLDSLEYKSAVMPVGMNINRIINRASNKDNGPPIILWNHRWEYDKNPELFFQTLIELDREGIDFRVMVLGSKTNKYPAIFDHAEKELFNKMVHFGHLTNKAAYYKDITSAHLLPVTNFQDFFGISVVEGIAAGAIPLLPKGLAYGAHLDPIEFPDLFYQTPTEFKEKLRSLILKLPHYKLQDKMEKYDWSPTTRIYDEEASKIVKNYIAKS